MILRCRLEELIKESGLRKDYIANELEISTRQLRNYELQKSYIPMDKAYILKDLLKLEKLDDLYEQEEELEHNN
jgi:predicted transcriptional regulator